MSTSKSLPSLAAWFLFGGRSNCDVQPRIYTVSGFFDRHSAADYSRSSAVLKLVIVCILDSIMVGPLYIRTSTQVLHRTYPYMRFYSFISINYYKVNFIIYLFCKIVLSLLVSYDLLIIMFVLSNVNRVLSILPGVIPGRYLCRSPCGLVSVLKEMAGYIGVIKCLQ